MSLKNNSSYYFEIFSWALEKEIFLSGTLALNLIEALLKGFENTTGV